MSKSDRTTKPRQVEQPIRFAIYARYSTNLQTDVTLESQEMMCRRAIAERGGVVVGVYTDAAIIGWTLDREGFIQMRDDAAKKKFDAVMMWKFDRLARDHTQATIIKTLFRREYGVKLYCVEGFSEDDDDSPYTSMMEQMMGVIASFYSRNLSTEVRRGMIYRHQQGKFNGSTAPLGYIFATETTPKHHRSIKATEALPPGLHIVPREAAIVRRAFRMYATGKHSYQSIADYLNSKAKYLNLNGEVIGITWVREMLINRLYCGEVSYAPVVYRGGFRQSKTSSRNRRTWHPGIHQAIISVDLFDACQQVLEKRSRGRGREKAAAKAYLLAGKLWCGYCLESKRPGLQDVNYGKMRCQKHHQVSGSFDYRYLCTSKSRGYAACGQKPVRCEIIDPQVIDALFHASSLLPKDVEGAVNMIISQRAETAIMIERMKEIEAIVKRIDLSWEHGFIGEAEYVQKRHALQIELDVLKPIDYDSLKEKAIALKDFPRHWKAAKSDEERQALVDKIVKAVIVKDRSVHAVVLHGDTALMVNNTGTLVGALGFEPRTYQL